jgi:short-subunit dehydrogenase
MADCRVLVLGATSAIAEAYARRRASEGAAFILVARNLQRLSAIAADLKVRGAAQVEVFQSDLAKIDRIETVAKMLADRFGEPDEALIAYGLLGQMPEAENSFALARELLETNFISAALWILALLRDRPPGRPFTLIAIGSVAGDRGRASNYIYGAGKGGLDRLLEGLAQKYEGTSVRIVTVKPGFVDTPMTAHIKKGGPLWATPEKIAADIARGVSRRRRVVYTPWFWRPIMLIIRHLPWFLYRRLKV